MHIYHNITVCTALWYIRYCRIYAVAVYTDTEISIQKGEFVVWTKIYERKGS